MHARPHRRKDQTSSHYDYFAISVSPVFAPARPRLARWEHKRPQGAGGR